MLRNQFSLALFGSVMVLSGCARQFDAAPDASSALSTCGDGIVDIGEQCDDGNDDTNDNCVSCSTASCGDGYVSASEECDPAVPELQKLCSNQCKRTFYGTCPADGCRFGDDPTEVPCGTAGKYCSPICTRDSDCPSMPGYRIECAYAYQCTIRCSGGCPTGMHCIDDDHCGYR